LNFKNPNKMKEKNMKTARINFGLKENKLPAKSIAPLSVTLDLNGAKRLFNAEVKFNSINKDESLSFSEENFSKIYSSLDLSDKSLYRIWYIDVNRDQDISQVLEELRKNPNVEFAEIDELNSLYYTPNDPYFSQMLSLKLIGSECAWKISQGDEIVIAVLDTGVNFNHPDIFSNMWKDANGNHGYDFSDNDNNPSDYHGHGSHCAGTIAAIGNNKTGIIGVAPRAKIMAVKIFPNAYDSNIALALKYAVDNGAKVLSNSWGPQERRPRASVLEAAVNYVHSKGGICVFAAGNNNDDTEYYSPANMANTITVSASDSNDKKASFSNFGIKVNVAAPGVDILSLMHNNTGYTTMSGTSMACPHVAGAVALLLKKNPSLNFTEVHDIIMNSSDPIDSTPYFGKGRINICSMLK
jgi:thermitase